MSVDYSEDDKNVVVKYAEVDDARELLLNLQYYLFGGSSLLCEHQDE